MKNTLQRTIVLMLLLSCMQRSTAWAQCTAPYLSSYVSDATPATATLTFACCLTGTYYLEYGPAGFTPGTAATAGAGGTVLSIPSNSNTYTLAGLNPATPYDCFIRRDCGGSVWSPNSIRVSFSTAPDCATTPVISCGTLSTLNISTGFGAWSFSASGCFNASQGREAMYRFTPTVTGNHVLFVHGVVPSNQNQILFYYKEASLGCNWNGWNCIGYSSTYENKQYSFGPLNAGTTYYILADAYLTGTPVTADQFRIECPYCTAPANVVQTSNSPSTVSLSWTGFASILEYGPAGFIPGTGSSAGAGGTIVSVFGSSFTLGSLSPSTLYDVYLRTSCVGSTFSPNSMKSSIYTTACPASYAYPGPGTFIYLNTGNTSYYNMLPACGSFNTPGEESVWLFTPPANGHYLVNVYYDYFNWCGFVYRPQAPVCNSSNYICPSAVAWGINSETYDIGPLSAGTTYEMLFDNTDTIVGSSSLSFRIDCIGPENVSHSDIQTNSVLFDWTCNCTGTTILEYGPAGFTPGTGSTAGPGGTVLSNVTPPYTLGGLTADMKYDVYLRNQCGGFFTNNTPVIHVQTAQDCSAAPAVSCSDHLYYSVAGFINTNNGAWENGACGGSLLAREGLWRFTPAQTGNYSILVYAFSANSIYYSYPASFYIKPLSAGCNEKNWSCVGNVSGSVYYGFTPVSLSLGSLTAGTTYLIMADGIQPTFTAGYAYYFRIDCPNVCEYPKLTGINAVSATGATVWAACDSCFGTVRLEYGPAGFTPGTGNSPGAGGTAVTVSAFPYAIGGLTPFTAYDVYARQNCGGGSYSLNSTKISFSTACTAAPTGVFTSAVNNTICAGESILLTQFGGAVAAGGGFKWYKDSCGGILAGTGNSITVSPGSSKTYYVRAEAACGLSACASAAVTVRPLPEASITASGSTTICKPESVTLNAVVKANRSYQWKRNGVIIPGATASSLVVTQSGYYKVIVTNTNSGCSNTTGNSTHVTAYSKPSARITPSGTVSFCAGQSALLTANSGNNYTYQWKKDGVLIPGAVNKTLTVTTPGLYKVIVTKANGCSKTSKADTVVVPCRGTGGGGEPASRPAIVVRPNPSSGDFVLDLPELSAESATIQLADAAGRLLLLDHAKSGQYTIHGDGLAAGTYILSVSGNHELQVVRLVKSPCY